MQKALGDYRVKFYYNFRLLDFRII